jgi:hypothetical protein
MFGQLQQMRDRLANTKVTGESGGGMVKITLTGDNRVEGVEIAPGAMDDRELLEDLVRAAMGEALRKVRDEMQNSVAQIAGGMLPPGMLPFGP